MSDFFKIFLFIGAVAAAFVFGRNYGEKTYREGAEYKDFIKEKEDLNYSKNEFENAKAKLQNIVDSADHKKTDELLGQILQVFLADLGLRVQYRDLILKQAQMPPAAAPAVTIAPKIPETISEAPRQRGNSSGWTKAQLNKFKSYEWMLENSGGGAETFRVLEKLKLKNLVQASGDLNYSKDECEEFLGTYSGKLNDTLKKYIGTLTFDFRTGKIDNVSSYYGTISLRNEANSNDLSEKIGNHCGRKISGLVGRVFNLTSDRYIQVYKLSNLEKLAGNFYEVLPNGTTHPAGAFILGRTDKF